MIAQETDNKLLIEQIWTSLNQFIKCPSSKKLRNHFEFQFQKIRLNIENYSHMKLIYALLQTPINIRTNQICNKLDESIGQFEYFRKLTQKYGQKCKNKIYSSMLSNMYKKGKTITKVGEQSNNFFIILKGEVIVLYPRDQNQIYADTIKIKSEITNILSKKQKILSIIENHHYYKGIYVEEIQDFQQYFNEFGIPLYYVENILGKGKAFGQLGIIYRQKRMSNIISKQQCLIATISAEKYSNLIAENQGQQISQMLLFLGQYFYSSLKSMDLYKAQRYYYIFTKIQRKINSTIFTSQTEVNGFYLILQGSVVLKTEQESYNQKEKMGRHHPSFMKQNYKKKLLEIKNLIYGQSFGLQQVVESLLYKKEKSFYKYIAITTSNVKLLFCPFNQLIKLIKFDKNLMLELQEKIIKKQILHKIQKQNIQLSRNITALSLNLSQKIHHEYNQQFPMRFIIKKIPAVQIRSPIYSKKNESLLNVSRSNARPTSSSVDNCVYQVQKSSNNIQKKCKNKKLWKRSSGNQSSLLINIINQKIKLFKKMKEETVKPKKKFIKYRNNFVKKATIKIL